MRSPVPHGVARSVKAQLTAAFEAADFAAATSALQSAETVRRTCCKCYVPPVTRVTTLPLFFRRFVQLNVTAQLLKDTGIVSAVRAFKSAPDSLPPDQAEQLKKLSKAVCKRWKKRVKKQQKKRGGDVAPAATAAPAPAPAPAVDAPVATPKPPRGDDAGAAGAAGASSADSAAPALSVDAAAPVPVSAPVTAPEPDVTAAQEQRPATPPPMPAARVIARRMLHHMAQVYTLESGVNVDALEEKLWKDHGFALSSYTMEVRSLLLKLAPPALHSRAGTAV